MTPLPERPHRILVIGAGPAGSACALRLRQHQFDVRVVEKQAFPRSKVCGCCVGSAGLQSLQQLGLRQRITACGLELTRWLGASQRHLIPIDLPAGLAISRETLDSELLAAAERAGATLEQPCQAQVREHDTEGVLVELRSEQDRRDETFSHVIVAGGLKVGGLQEVLPWTEPPHGPFGVSFTLPGGDRIPAGTIQMACADDGYVGQVRLENGRIDVAAALRGGCRSAGGRRPIDRVGEILAASRLGPIDLEAASSVLTTPPLRRRRLAGRGRLLAVGDAAGYVEPFTGEGITWALQTGIAAADLIAQTGENPGTAGDRWRDQSARLLWQRTFCCRLLTGALRSKTIRHAGGFLLSRYPVLRGPVVRGFSGINAGGTWRSPCHDNSSDSG